MSSSFSGVGKGPGLTVWRIEAFKPVLQGPEAVNGQFYAGSTLVDLTRSDANANLVMYDCHLWGAKKTQYGGSTAFGSSERLFMTQNYRS